MFLFYLKRALQEVTSSSVCVIWFQHCAHLNKPIEPRLIQNNILLCWPCPDSEAKKVFIPVPEHQGRRQRTALIESLVWFVSVEKHTPRAPQSGKRIDLVAPGAVAQGPVLAWLPASNWYCTGVQQLKSEYEQYRCSKGSPNSCKHTH